MSRKSATDLSSFNFFQNFLHYSKIFLAILSTLVLFFIGLLWNKLDWFQNSIAKANLVLGKLEDGAMDILLVGTDSRTDAHGNPLTKKELRMIHAGNAISTNTDTIILIRIPKNHKSAVAVSIPRDTYITLTDSTKTKINSIYGTQRETVRLAAVKAGLTDKEAEVKGITAGQKALIAAVSNFAGIEIDKYAEIGLLGFILLTDAVGGVPICLRHAVNEPMSGAHFQAGEQLLNGSKALSFVRQRHDLPRGDLDRIVRQQTFMAALAHKILSSGTLSNPNKLTELKNAISRSVTIDKNWNIIDFANQLTNLTKGNIKFETIPIVKENGWSDDKTQSVVLIDEIQIKNYFKTLVKESDMGINFTENSHLNIAVFNSTDREGLAALVSSQLSHKGYQTDKVANYSGDKEPITLLRINPSSQTKLKPLMKILGDPKIDLDDSLNENQIQIILGEDFISKTTLDLSSPPPNYNEASPLINAAAKTTCVN